MGAPDAISSFEDLVFVDLETTGGNPARHRITEVGIVRMRGDDVLEEWSSLVNPQCAIPAHIERFTGISNAMVAAAPTFEELAPLVLEKLAGATLVAHNARFDYSFLRGECRRLAVNFSTAVLCTVKLSRNLFPEHARHNLDSIMERHNLRCSARHRALGDAQVLKDLWIKLRSDVAADTLAQAATRAMLRAPALPAHLPPQLVDELPEGPGTFRYFDADGTLLYVGRARSLRTSVLAQLADPRAGSRDHALASEVRRVDWTETAGELGAALDEAHWLKTTAPRYNRRLAGRDAWVTLRLDVTRRGEVDVVRLDCLEPEELASCFGLFATVRAAHKALKEIARNAKLCLKSLGLEASEGTCLAFHLGGCKGVCAGLEAAALHAMRAQLALSSLKIRSWPFSGRIAIRERAAEWAWRDAHDEHGAQEEWHVLEDWRHLGSARSAEELDALGSRSSERVFDADMYRLLQRYFEQHPQLEWRALSASPAGH